MRGANLETRLSSNLSQFDSNLSSFTKSEQIRNSFAIILCYQIQAFLCTWPELLLSFTRIPLVLSPCFTVKIVCSTDSFMPTSDDASAFATTPGGKHKSTMFSYAEPAVLGCSDTVTPYFVSCDSSCSVKASISASIDTANDLNQLNFSILNPSRFPVRHRSV